MKENVLLIQAGAGSGKTTRICEEIAKRVAAGLAPERILATTFTKKAARELKARAQTILLKHEGLGPPERAEKASALDRALFGTVHSVGHRLLQRYALRLGISPHLETVEEEAEKRHLRQLLDQTDPARRNALAEVAGRLGQDKFDDLALKLLAIKRTNAIGDDAFRAQLKGSASALLGFMAPGGPDSKLASADAWAEAERAAGRIEDIVKRDPKASQKTKDCGEGLRARLSEARGRWGDWAWFAACEAGKRDGGEAELASLREFSSRVWEHPGLHQDLTEFARLLAEHVIELGQSYARYKLERGLVDFTDLEERFLGLLHDPEVKRDIAASIDLVVVDEFQDTNPIQLAIFQELASAARESIWVGDEKQAIYGFRGTDAQLMRDLVSSVPRQDRLPNCYRSGEGLVKFVGALFSRVRQFGDAAMLRHVKDLPSQVDRWALAGNKEASAQAIALGIGEACSSGTRPGDIAVLVRKNSDAEEVGKALRARRVPVVVEIPGLLSTREGLVVCAGLRLVADRNDSLAGATLLHFLSGRVGGTPEWFTRRLAQIGGAQEDLAPWEGDGTLAALERIAAGSSGPAGIMQAVVQSLRLPDRCGAWGEPAKRAANLDALLALAAEYEEEMRQERRPATLTGLIAWLEKLRVEEEDSFPLPEGLDAVTVTTIHKAKGLDWPTVLLACISKERGPDPWEPFVSGGNAREGQPLEGRKVTFYPWPFGRSKGRRGEEGKPTRDGTGSEKRLLASPLGAPIVAAEAAERERVLYVSFTRAKDRFILAHSGTGKEQLAPLEALDGLLPPGGGPESLREKGVPAGYTWRELAAREEVIRPAEKQVWIADEMRLAEPVARYWQPSEAPAVAGAAAQMERVGPRLEIGRLEPDVANRLGEAFHTYLGSLPSTRGLGAEGRRAVATRCLEAWQVAHVIPSETFVEVGERFESWVEARWPGAEWCAEVPMTAPRDGGGQWNGSADLILLTKEGKAVLIDHKGIIIAEGDEANRAGGYSGQLAAYRAAMESNGLSVAAALIHFPLSGCTVLVGVG